MSYVMTVHAHIWGVHVQARMTPTAPSLEWDTWLLPDAGLQAPVGPDPL